MPAASQKLVAAAVSVTLSAILFAYAIVPAKPGLLA
ncbi:MAG: enoyl-CoA hydratase [Erythrobacter sp.]